MNARWLLSLALPALCGCATDPLVGRWTASTTRNGITLSTSLTLGADNSVSVTDTGMGACTGTRRYTGLTWGVSRTSAAATLTFAGVSDCSGSITCTQGGSTVTLGCPTPPAPRMTSACGFAVSADGNTLTLSDCSGQGGSAATYTRASL